MTAKATASTEPRPEASEEQIEIDLKDPLFAAFLAWLIPGMGHWYQGRRHKAVLFFVCILGTFFYGLYLGEGRVVYASMRDNDRRLPYLCQVGVGLPALPALIQAKRKVPFQVPIFKDKDFMAPPKEVLPPGSMRTDDLDRLHKRLHRYWELGTVYTMIAGLLNILAIYDAWGGPAFSTPAKKDEDDKPDDSGGKENET
ncbi:MAG TPA: DUF6677 family protein [Pirellulales bacterium]|nr:DUF6677 family protein [Pirellulales bacterium]